MALKPDDPLVNAALARIKAPLAALRLQHRVVGDVQFLIRYNSSGEIVTVTVSRSTSVLGRAFVDTACGIIRGTVRIPGITEPGQLAYVDTDPDPAIAAQGKLIL